MQVAERLQDDILVLMVSGRVTFYSRKVFKAIVSNARLSGAKHIIFNVEGVTFMDSAALGELALAYLNLKENNLVMSLVGPQEPIQKLLDEANFPTLIPTYPTEESVFQPIK